MILVVHSSEEMGAGVVGRAVAERARKRVERIVAVDEEEESIFNLCCWIDGGRSGCVDMGWRKKFIGDCVL